jgi:hypothetical protein
VTNIATRWCPQTIAKLVQITPITLVYRYQWEFLDDVVTNIAIMELMAVDGVVAIETFSDMDMTWLNGNFNFRIQYMEVRKRTIVLAI